MAKVKQVTARIVFVVTVILSLCRLHSNWPSVMFGFRVKARVRFADTKVRVKVRVRVCLMPMRSPSYGALRIGVLYCQG